MKSLVTILLTTIFTSVVFSFTQCKKHVTSSSITLYNQSLQTIQSNIKGKWVLHYSKGGICSVCMQRYDGVFWEFSGDNRIKVINKGSITTDTTITWIRQLGTFTNGDSTFVMNFYNKQPVPVNWVANRIYNDTLEVYENSSDQVFYRLTRSK